MGRRTTVAAVLFVAILAVAAPCRRNATSAKAALQPAGRQPRCRTHRLSSAVSHIAPSAWSIPELAGRPTIPYAEINLTTRLSELTKTRVSRDESQQPNFYVVRLTDDALFNCPITVASDAGTIGIREDEAERLRTYLLKGGFLWADDFWGSAAWDHWESQIAKVLPPSEYPIEDVDIERSAAPQPVRSERDSADHQHPVLAAERRTGDVRTRRGQRGRALPRDPRQASTASWC